MAPLSANASGHIATRQPFLTESAATARSLRSLMSPHACITERRYLGRHCVACNAGDDEQITLEEDWRAFRARKIRQEQAREPSEDAGGPVCRANQLLLRQQNPYLAEEGLWAEPAESLQPGRLLVATPSAGLRDPRYEQLVVLILEHGTSGASGVILNRPSSAVVEDLLGWGWSPGEGGAALTAVFGNERVYLGAMFSPARIARQPTTFLHGYADIAGSREIAPGLYVGGQAAAAKQVLSGNSLPSVRFFAGMLTWTAEELADELDSDVWFRAACSRVVALKQCLQLPLPLWREVLFLMGSVHARIAAAP